MTPLPSPLGSGEVVAWRLVRTEYAETWDSGEGAFLNGGRWNTPGHRTVYCSFDPATTILEAAVHLGFDFLDRVPHDLISLLVLDPASVHVIAPEQIANLRWMRPQVPVGAQQVFGDSVLAGHPVTAIPSVVSQKSWNLLLSFPGAAGRYELRTRERFALDPRLRPA